MRRLFMKTAMIISVIMISAGVSCGADVELSLDVNSAYVWRGVTFNDGIVAQPSIDVTKGGFGINVWGNMDLSDYDDTLNSGQFSEIDLTLSYSFPIEIMDLSVGYIEYMFPGGDTEAAREIYVSVGYSPIEAVSIGMDVYYEVDEIKDYYACINASYSFDFTEEFGIEISASAGYIGDDYSAGGDGGFNDYNFSLAANYAVNTAIRIGANINYTGSFDDDVLPDGPYARDVKTYGGVSISYAY